MTLDDILKWLVVFAIGKFGVAAGALASLVFAASLGWPFWGLLAFTAAGAAVSGFICAYAALRMMS